MWNAVSSQQHRTCLHSKLEYTLLHGRAWMGLGDGDPCLVLCTLAVYSVLLAMCARWITSLACAVAWLIRWSAVVLVKEIQCRQAHYSLHCTALLVERSVLTLFWRQLGVCFCAMIVHCSWLLHTVWAYCCSGYLHTAKAGNATNTHMRTHLVQSGTGEYFLTLVNYSCFTGQLALLQSTPLHFGEKLRFSRNPWRFTS